MEVALFPQGAQLVGNTTRTSQPNCLSDLAHRRGIPPLLYRLPDDLEHLTLSPGQHMARIELVWRLGDSVRRTPRGFAAWPRYIEHRGCHSVQLRTCAGARTGICHLRPHRTCALPPA